MGDARSGALRVVLPPAWWPRRLCGLARHSIFPALSLFTLPPRCLLWFAHLAVAVAPLSRGLDFPEPFLPHFTSVRFPVPVFYFPRAKRGNNSSPRYSHHARLLMAIPTASAGLVASTCIDESEGGEGGHVGDGAQTRRAMAGQAAERPCHVALYLVTAP